MSHKRYVDRAHRLKKIYIETSNGYGCGVWYDEEKQRYVRYSCKNSDARRRLNRIIRRKYKQNPDAFQHAKGNAYRKIKDYYWEIT